jgi:hypothetical protein
MNDAQAMRKIKDRHASMRDFRFEPRHGNLTSIEQEMDRVNAATHKEDMTIGPQDPHPNATFR